MCVCKGGFGTRSTNHCCGCPMEGLKWPLLETMLQELDIFRLSDFLRAEINSLEGIMARLKV